MRRREAKERAGARACARTRLLQERGEGDAAALGPEGVKAAVAVGVAAVRLPAPAPLAAAAASAAAREHREALPHGVENEAGIRRESRGYLGPGLLAEDEGAAEGAGADGEGLREGEEESYFAEAVALLQLPRRLRMQTGRAGRSACVSYYAYAGN